jgi:hypothetical protein
LENIETGKRKRQNGERFKCEMVETPIMNDDELNGNHHAIALKTVNSLEKSCRRC